MNQTFKIRNYVVIGLGLLIISFFLFDILSPQKDFVSNTEKTVIIFPKKRINVNKISTKKEKKIDIKFTNAGNVPLIIYKIGISCECTKIALPEKPILPGQKASIQVSFKKVEKGNFNKIISIYGNLKKNPQTINITGEFI